MQIANFRYLTILDELRYLPEVSVSDRFLVNSIKSSLESVGQSYSKALLHLMCSFNGLSENELLTNFDLFERSIYRILGKSGQSIISAVKADMLRYAIMNGSEITLTDILDPRLTVSYVLKHIHEREVLDFVRNMPPHEHKAFSTEMKILKITYCLNFFIVKNKKIQYL